MKIKLTRTILVCLSSVGTITNFGLVKVNHYSQSLHLKISAGDASPVPACRVFAVPIARVHVRTAVYYFNTIIPAVKLASVALRG